MQTPPAMSEFKSDIFEVFSAGSAMSQMRAGVSRCPFQIRAIHSLLEDVMTERRMPLPAEVERKFQELGDCLQASGSEIDASNCTQAKKAMASACGRDLEKMNDDIAQLVSGVIDERKGRALLSSQIDSLPHTGTSQHSRCVDTIGGFFECLWPVEMDQESMQDFQKLYEIQMFLIQQQQQQQQAGGF